MKKIKLSGIKNIIFDLGGVIIHLNEPRTHAALAEFAGISTADFQKRIQENLPLFHDFERGHISNEDFLGGLRELTGNQDVTDSQLTEAWNAMLMELPESNIDMLKKLAGEYRLFMFSNTNDIHIQEVHKRIKAVSGLPDFTPVFEKVYYSQQVGERKPDTAAFRLVLEEQGLKPAETLFIDDNPSNIKSAAGLGIQTLHYPINTLLEDGLNGTTER